MPQTDTVTPLVHANDKLLKALITLLALRDEHLMDELRSIFVLAGRHGNEIGEANKATWAHLRHELDLIAQLVGEVEDEDHPPAVHN